MSEKPFIVQSHDIHLDSEYREWLLEVKKRYRNAQIKAAMKVNSEQLLFNWQLGRDLVLRRNALDDNIRSDLYHTAGAAITNYTERLPLPQGKLALELTKGNYDLGFLTLHEGYDENELETALEHHMTRFLLELGKGWAFVGRQKEIIVSGKSRKIDLLFYHIHLRFYMVVELKVKPFEPEFAGKLNFYVNAVDELIRTENENPTIGLLICRDMESTEVQWALQGITTPIGVATYSNVKIEEVRAQLPTTEQIKACIELAEKEFLQSMKQIISKEVDRIVYKEIRILAMKIGRWWD